MVQRARLKLNCPESVGFSSDVGRNETMTVNDANIKLPQNQPDIQHNIQANLQLKPLSMKSLRLSVGPPPGLGLPPRPSLLPVILPPRKSADKLTKTSKRKKKQSSEQREVIDIPAIAVGHSLQTHPKDSIALPSSGSSSDEMNTNCEHNDQIESAAYFEDTDYDDDYDDDLVADYKPQPWSQLKSVPDDVTVEHSDSYDYDVDQSRSSDEDYEHDDFVAEGSPHFEKGRVLEHYAPTAATAEPLQEEQKDAEFDAYAEDMLRSMRDWQQSMNSQSNTKTKPFKSSGKSESLQSYEAKLQAQADQLRDSLLAKLSALEGLM